MADDVQIAKKKTPPTTSHMHQRPVVRSQDFEGMRDARHCRKKTQRSQRLPLLSICNFPLRYGKAGGAAGKIALCNTHTSRGRNTTCQTYDT